MQPEEIRRRLKSALDTKDRVIIPLSLLSDLEMDDVPDGVSFEVGTENEDSIQLDWGGKIYRQGSLFKGVAEYAEYRKYWYSPLGLEQYMDLVRRAVESRQRLRGDVEIVNFEDDGAYIFLYFSIKSSETNPARAFEAFRRTSSQLEETAERAADEVGSRIAEVAARLSGWGVEPLDKLVEKVEKSVSADEKGRSLEELASRLFDSVEGFSITGRIRTATEEIDVLVLNNSPEPRLRRESAIILIECKNWSSKCGKDEFVLFKEKVENRNRRCSLGILISWNGFASTVTKEMLRGTKEETLIVPLTGAELRAAVHSGDFLRELLVCWDRAVRL